VFPEVKLLKLPRRAKAGGGPAAAALAWAVVGVGGMGGAASLFSNPLLEPSKHWPWAVKIVVLLRAALFHQG
jgi:hypothetical protein